MTDQEVAAPSGEIAVFLSALGAREGSLEILEIIGRVGPRMERHEVARGGVSWTYLVFGPHGVTLQLKDGVLVGALVYLVDEEAGGTYPRPDALIDGLVLPASRADVRALLGAPDRSSQLLDLYRFGDRYLSFDLVDEQVVSVSAMLADVAPDA